MELEMAAEERPTTSPLAATADDDDKVPTALGQLDDFPPLYMHVSPKKKMSGDGHPENLPTILSEEERTSSESDRSWSTGTVAPAPAVATSPTHTMSSSPSTPSVLPPLSAPVLPPPTAPLRSKRSTETVRRLSAADLTHLAATPSSLPVAVMSAEASQRRLSVADLQALRQAILTPSPTSTPAAVESAIEPRRMHAREMLPRRSLRTLSSPPVSRRKHSESPTRRRGSPVRRNSTAPSLPPALSLPPLDITESEALALPARPRSAMINPTAFIIPDSPAASVAAADADADDNNPPEPDTIALPVPPMSLPTHLELELAAGRPSQLYIYRATVDESPYESSAVKFQRLLNMLLLPPFLERTLSFGVLACLDAWLYTFTILPIRFVMALWLLVKWWAYVVAKECRWLVGFVWYGLGRLWTRAAHRADEPSGQTRSRRPTGATLPEGGADGLMDSRGTHDDLSQGSRGLHDDLLAGHSNLLRRISHLNKRRTSQSHVYNSNNPSHGSLARPPPSLFRHRRTKSMPSALSPFHKADILQGAVILFSCAAMMKMDASRMYHFIRGQSDIKLYVIFNILEVTDRLLSALGQDILECLFSSEMLSRNSQGRSKVLMPLAMFVLALVYTTAHAATLYFHAITLNVAVNAYSNALLTLLMSNQFVEVKSTVFKRFEKDNLFQLTCADIVERFQLWVMLVIIGLRNVVEMGGLSVPGSAGGAGFDEPRASTMPIHSPSILPHSFTVLPSWLLSGEVLSPFVIVIASEVFVDSVKHAYVSRFNSIKPAFYGRVLDILCKDYYTDAFVTPTLPRRLGLAVIPLSCLFIRASMQTYHMFLSTHLAPPLPPSTQTSLSQQSATPSPAIIDAFNKFDSLIRDSLGRAVHADAPTRRWFEWTSDDAIALLTMLVVFFIFFLVALILKLLLGMLLLHYSRNRYAKMMLQEERIATGQAERDSLDAKSKRLGGYGHVEVGEERKRWINADATEGLKKINKDKKWDKASDFAGVSRYEMVAKRIW